MLKKLTFSIMLSACAAAVAAIALVPILASPSFAVTYTVEGVKIDCNQPKSGVEEKFCAGKSYEAADKRLNEVYQQVSARLSGDRKNQLIDVQKTWIKFRDDSCSFETYMVRDTTGYGVFLLECLERLTQRRTAALENYLSFIGGSNVSPTLKLGARGEDVVKLQKLLNEPKLSLQPVNVDGVFGKTTENVVKEFQRKAKLPVDGVVGPKTWEKLGDVVSF